MTSNLADRYEALRKGTTDYLRLKALEPKPVPPASPLLRRLAAAAEARARSAKQ